MNLEINKYKQILDDLGPLYHDFSFFGLKNNQISKQHILNQQNKAPIIISYISYARAMCSLECAKESPSFTELFCADGYYSMVASRLGCSKTIGIDNNNENYLDKAIIIAERIGLENCHFIKSNITEDKVYESTDIVANLGGLYHVDNPKEILKNSFNQARKFLILQSVVSIANNSNKYFEKPAPGWNWGCRFSRSSFHKMVSEMCPNIINYHFNVLHGNSRLEDKGSVYYLIKK